MVNERRQDMKITYRDLVKRSNCSDQLKKFKKLFPDGIEINKKSLDIAVNAELDIDWLAESFLQGAQLAVYKQLTKLTRIEYYKLYKRAWNAYVKTDEEAQYDATHKSALRNFEKATDEAWAKLQAKRTEAFLNAIKTKEER